ncbi:MAG: hypothetical protein GF330_02210 [Candidatus Eisenbacteria bacterium]|nr:hypothetical protein [Candidatus Eisenbacteria bacterium]
MPDREARPLSSDSWEASASSLWVVAIGGTAEPVADLGWDLLRRCEPRLRHLAHLTDSAIPLPKLHRLWRHAPESHAPRSPESESTSSVSAPLAHAHRVAIVTALPGAGPLGAVFYWHHRIGAPGGPGVIHDDGAEESTRSMSDAAPRLSQIRIPSSARYLGLYHLPLWIEEEVPPGGLDFIGVCVPVGATAGAASAFSRQRPLILAAMTGLLWRIMREMAETEPQRRAAAA